MQTPHCNFDRQKGNQRGKTHGLQTLKQFIFNENYHQ